ncbi:MAG: flagellar motor switch protein FliG, partial [Clostridiales bacterium]|nr:flagellar motor switch protein FliG [Clostridiales bacterium]
KDELEYMGPVRLKDVEEAQQKIINIIRRLEEAGSTAEHLLFQEFHL